MAYAHVQGVAATRVAGLGTALTVSWTNTAGNCLLLSVGIYLTPFNANYQRYLITDTQSNAWIPVGMSPVQEDITSPGMMLQIFTYAALNCKAGANVITAQPAGAASNCYASAIADEYSGVAALRAIDQVTFGSTPWAGGATSVDSGNITIPEGEMLYSVAFSDNVANSFSVTAGFTARSSVNADLMAMASFDQIAPALGVYSNTVTVVAAPDSLHVILFSLSSAVVVSPVVQVTFNSLAGGFTDVPATFALPNIAGNSLVLMYQGQDQATFTVTDSNANTWIIAPGVGSDFLLAYALNIASGPNTVNIHPATSGTSLNEILIVLEYEPLQMFTQDSIVQSSLGNSLDTGAVGVMTPPNLLISAFFDDGTNPPVVANPGIVRFQVSESGYRNQYPGTLVVADQLETLPGSYSDLFTVDHSGTSKWAGILGFFLIGPPPPPVNPGNTFSPCGKMPTLELTRDLDADWDDESTFFITQEQPFPFTLRGIVLRLSYNQD